MKSTPLIKQLQEDGAAVGAGAVAFAATPLFAKLVRRSRKPRLKVLTSAPSSKRIMGVKESFDRLKNIIENQAVDATSVISKLKNLEKIDQSATQPMATFGLEDQSGHIVRVSVPVDQGDDFEKSLQASLSADDDQNAEIAEILFDLKDRFDILDVDWGEVAEDEEELPVDGELPADRKSVV